MNSMRLNYLRLYFVFVFASGAMVLQAQTKDSAADVLATEALRVLQTKCNTCHVRQNPGKVFTRITMERYAEKIDKQVFIKRRMPKGKDNHLSMEEENTLRAWLQQYPRKP